VNWETLLPMNAVQPGTLLAVAAWVGSTRLIDNAILQ
jgi:pantoate--beta-alanine ligase